MVNLDSLKEVGIAAGERIVSLSKSNAKRSPAQEEYAAVLRGLLAEREWSSPFDSQDAVQIKDFFDEAARRWGIRKAELGLA